MRACRSPRDRRDPAPRDGLRFRSAALGRAAHGHSARGRHAEPGERRGRGPPSDGPDAQHRGGPSRLWQGAAPRPAARGRGGRGPGGPGFVGLGRGLACAESRLRSRAGREPGSHRDARRGPRAHGRAHPSVPRAACGRVTPLDAAAHQSGVRLEGRAGSAHRGCPSRIRRIRHALLSIRGLRGDWAQRRRADGPSLLRTAPSQRRCGAPD